MNRTLLVASIALVSIGMVACKREAPLPPAQQVATAPPAAQQVATAPPAAPNHSDLVKPEGTGFHGTDFAGKFTGTLPCADCAAIDETLALKPDGSFTLTEAYRGRPKDTHVLAGNWTTENHDKRLRLSLGTKVEEDHLYAIASHDEVAALGRDGRQASGPALHRVP